jgi:GTP-binding protein Era
VTDVYEKEMEEAIITRLNRLSMPVYLLINKVDQASQEVVNERIAYWTGKTNAKEIIPVSALEKFNLEKILNLILENIPEHPAYYDKDQITDKPERFFAAEILREKIFLNYKKEIPYSTEVVITDFIEKDNIIEMRAQIYVERDSQKGIIIGNKGDMLKKIGTEARKEMEIFFGKKVFLEQHVKVEPDWRNKENKLRNFGYNH